jgi:hypothetical protein
MKLITSRKQAFWNAQVSFEDFFLTWYVLHYETRTGRRLGRCTVLWCVILFGWCKNKSGFCYFERWFLLSNELIFNYVRIIYHFEALISFYWFMLMVLFSLFILVHFMLSRERWINSKFDRFYCMSSKWGVKQQKLLAIWTKHLARGPSAKVQLNIGSENFVMEMRALKMRRVVDALLQLTTTHWGLLL